MAHAKIRPDAVGFDFDGVIADIGEAFLRLACDRYGYCSLKIEDISSFQVEECIDMERAMVNQIFEDILEDSLATGLQPISGAIDTLSRLSGLSEVTIITARPKSAPVLAWLNHYCRPEVVARIRLIVTGDHDNKEAYIKQCGLSHFIDDRAVTCVQLAEAGLNPIVYTQPWNIDRHHLPTVDDWLAIASLLGLPRTSHERTRHFTIKTADHEMSSLQKKHDAPKPGADR